MSSEITLNLTREDIGSLKRALFAAYTVNYLCEDKGGTTEIENLRAEIESQIANQEADND